MACIYQVSSGGLDGIAHSEQFSKERHYANLADAQQYMRQLMRDICRAHNRAMLKAKGYTADIEWAGESTMKYPAEWREVPISEYEERWEAWEHEYQVQIVSIAVLEKFNSEEE